MAVKSNQPVVCCVGITKYFGGVRALNKISLDVHPGEVLALVGENGAGKSTLVKILSGIEQPDEGSIWLGEMEVKRLSPHRARAFGIETVYQHLSLCDNLDAAANVMLGQEPVRFKLGPFKFLDMGGSFAMTRERINDLGVHLPDLAVPVRRLSGGQRQAVALARATVRAHRLVMLDEPAAALGVTQTQATRDLIRRVAAHGVGVIVISHNLDDVFAVANRVVVLRLGQITLDTSLCSTNRGQIVACMTGMSFGQTPSADLSAS